MADVPKRKCDCDPSWCVVSKSGVLAAAGPGNLADPLFCDSPWAAAWVPQATQGGPLAGCRPSAASEAARMHPCCCQTLAYAHAAQSTLPVLHNSACGGKCGDNCTCSCCGSNSAAAGGKCICSEACAECHGKCEGACSCRCSGGGAAASGAAQPSCGCAEGGGRAAGCNCAPECCKGGTCACGWCVAGREKGGGGVEIDCSYANPSHPPHSKCDGSGGDQCSCTVAPECCKDGKCASGQCSCKGCSCDKGSSAAAST
jgi:hypothetical protein